ncbi:hypothetical protein [Mycobacterium sp. Root265]|uniref:hypothetical protein n=1 Tax=Mycobacterium sp. Root265 TaxID=1736504 RepID=UPI0012E3E4DF|nr:hypothetical protein [Mycobacterium sp. Root265]
MINPFFAAMMLVGLGLPMLPTKSASAERRLYWAGAAVAVFAAFFTIYPPDWRGGLVFASSIAGVMVLRAYMTTSYLRIRGRTFAFNLSDSEQDSSDHAVDAYAGFATAPKMWWLFTVVTGGCALIVAMYLASSEGRWYAAGSALVVVLLPLMIGHQDASWGYGVARGQIVQLVVVGVVTVGVFILAYFIGYKLGTHWPLRSKLSPEYRRRA